MASRPPPRPSSSSEPPHLQRSARRGAVLPQPGKPPIPNNGGGYSLKLIIWTGAFAAVTIVGTIYGAGLKTQKEYKEEKQKIIQASAQDRVRDLEQRRAGLVAQRMPLERKLRELRERINAQELESKAAGAEGNKK